jgi:aminomethyltransferase
MEYVTPGKADSVLPIGLAARDSLRFEACISLYGHEISATMVSLKWLI